MNEEVSGNQKDSGPITDLENFRKQYAMVLLQLRDANDQVASALLYMSNITLILEIQHLHGIRPIESFVGSVTHQGSFNPALLTQDSGSNMLEIIQSSRQKARTMVDVAVQATHGLKEEEDAFVRIGVALYLNNINSNSRYIPSDPTHENSSYQDHTISCKFEATTCHILSPKSNILNDGNEVQFSVEMISNCVGTLFVIQNCAERQYLPADVAHVLDSAVSSLQPSCP